MTTPRALLDEPAEPHILFVEDDAVIRDTVRIALQRYGFTVSTAADGLTGLELFRSAQPDLLLLDVMLPELDGIGLCRKIREFSLAPILMVTARGDDLDMISGLEAGADDYVVKPCETAVLVARIRSLLRRASFAPAREEPPREAREDGGTARAGTPGGARGEERTGATDGSGVLTFGDLTIDTYGMEVRRAGEVVALTPTELRLLLVFAASPGVVLERRTLLRKVWDHAWDGDARVVDLHVKRLRAKIDAERIETVRGFGYKLRR
ncbi:response regulator transcription factor [Streptomyces sp. NPDC051662]|uniref:response regulator transcription factor n=1 Tax=Streptomyces sp. NPDC051662 TaxID=3154750 RepID=UPI00342CF435